MKASQPLPYHFLKGLNPPPHHHFIFSLAGSRHSLPLLLDNNAVSWSDYCPAAALMSTCKNPSFWLARPFIHIASHAHCRQMSPSWLAASVVGSSLIRILSTERKSTVIISERHRAVAAKHRFCVDVRFAVFYLMPRVFMRSQSCLSTFPVSFSIDKSSWFLRKYSVVVSWIQSSPSSKPVANQS